MLAHFRRRNSSEEILVRRAHPPAILIRFSSNEGLTTSDKEIQAKKFAFETSPNQVLTHAARAAAKQLNRGAAFSGTSGGRARLSDVVRPSFEANRFKIAGGCAWRTTREGLCSG